MQSRWNLEKGQLLIMVRQTFISVSLYLMAPCVYLLWAAGERGMSFDPAPNPTLLLAPGGERRKPGELGRSGVSALPSLETPRPLPVRCGPEVHISLGPGCLAWLFMCGSCASAGWLPPLPRTRGGDRGEEVMMKTHAVQHRELYPVMCEGA